MATRTSTCATTRAARTTSCWHHIAGCRQWLEVARDTRDARRSSASARRRPTAARSRADEPQPFRLPRRAALIDRTRPLALHLRRPRATRAMPATRWPRRCSPTACTWSAAASSTTGRAASSRAGAEEPNALVAARRRRAHRAERARDHGRALRRARSPRARTAGRRSRFDLGAVNGLLAPLLPAGFYYKTFMWPPRSGSCVYEPLIRRAAGLGRRRARARSRPLRAALRALRRAGGRRRPGRARGGARRRREPARASSCADERRRARRHALLAERRRSTARARPTGSRATLGALARCRRSRCCRARRRSATTTTTWSAPSSASPITCREHRRRRASASGRIRARQVVLATGAHRAAARLRRQRPARRHAGRRRARLPRTATAWRPGDARWSFTNNDGAYRDARSTLPRPASRSRRSSIAARRRRRRSPSARATPASESWHGRVVAAAPRQARSVEAVERRAARRRRRAARLDCDLVAVSGGWNPAVHLSASRRAAGLVAKRSRAFVPGAPRQAERSAGAARGMFDSCRCLADGVRAGAEAAAAAGFGDGAPPQPPPAADEPTAGAAAAAAGAVPRRQRARRSSTSRTTSPPPTSRSPQREGYSRVEH